MIREEIILDFVKGKDVLDIGSVGDCDAEKHMLWEAIKKQAKKAIGIDLEPSHDKDVVQADMETYDFKKQFDVIVAGDVLEHVSNQGLFLDNIKKHLKDDGQFVLTTPNAKWITVLLKPPREFKDKNSWHNRHKTLHLLWQALHFEFGNPTHTLWHDRHTLKHILSRSGFEITRFQYYYGNAQHYNLLMKLITLKQEMLVVCKKHSKTVIK
ncbi:MAG: class I SAM-dependent methyltransferase [Candidatus Diapherotrites archaeon]|nr:class I SAM-dependent methyltransferase [Candidatus Diapherotrites archaeon]